MMAMLLWITNNTDTSAGTGRSASDKSNLSAGISTSSDTTQDGGNVIMQTNNNLDENTW
jgi:hypothetical protein